MKRYADFFSHFTRNDKRKSARAKERERERERERENNVALCARTTNDDVCEFGVALATFADAWRRKRSGDSASFSRRTFYPGGTKYS